MPDHVHLLLSEPELAEEEKVEEHLLACDVCGDSLREVSSLIDAIREMARKGTLNVVVSQEFLCEVL